MTIAIPQKVGHILETFQKAGYEAYAVGGCIRDSILGKTPKDWDITTNAKPEEIKKIFPRTVDTGIAHGTVTILLGKERFEATAYRVDGVYEDARRPKEVTFTQNLLEDLKRRDFTINAMAYHPAKGLVDAFDGVGDLRRKVVRCVGDARLRFTEDALRMMRAVRFASQLGFAIEEETKKAICQMASSLDKISVERIQGELVGILTSDHPEGLNVLYETGMTKAILPEFDLMMQTKQKNPHHKYTVGEHTIVAVGHIKKEKTLRLAMLLHDVAKPMCKATGEDGVDHFYGHPQVGSEMAGRILRRLKFDNKTTRQVCRLVAWHDDTPPLTPKSIRKAVVKIGAEAFPALFAVKRADILAQSDYKREEKLKYVDEYEKIYLDRIERNECLCLKNLAVTGADLIQEGMEPGPAIGEVLQELFELVLEEPKKNTREYLLQKVKGRIL